MDLLEYGDFFDGNFVIVVKVEELKVGVWVEFVMLDQMGGVIVSIEYMKFWLVDFNVVWLNWVEDGEIVVVGVNCWQQGEVLLLMVGDGGIMVVDLVVEQEQIVRLDSWW